MCAGLPHRRTCVRVRVQVIRCMVKITIICLEINQQGMGKRMEPVTTWGHRHMVTGLAGLKPVLPMEILVFGRGRDATIDLGIPH